LYELPIIIVHMYRKWQF